MLNEADNVGDLAEHLAAIERANPDCEFEVILVDDGSTDLTSDLVAATLPNDIRYTILRLSRNFGSHYAMSAGFKHATGDCGIMIGGDLQEPPSLISDFLQQWRDGHEIVWGIRETRAKINPVNKLFSVAFSSLFTRFAEIKSYPPEGPSGVLIDRKVIDIVTAMPEHNRNIYGLIAWSGFSQTRVHYHQLSRNAGVSKWTRRKMLKLAIDSFVQFSTFPMRMMTWTGVIVAGAGFGYALLLIVRTLLGVTVPSGWTTVMVAILVLSGVQMITMGVLGAYQWRTIEEVRKRPLYIIANVHTSDAWRQPRPVSTQHRTEQG